MRVIDIKVIVDEKPECCALCEHVMRFDNCVDARCHLMFQNIEWPYVIAPEDLLTFPKWCPLELPTGDLAKFLQLKKTGKL